MQKIVGVPIVVTSKKGHVRLGCYFLKRSNKNCQKSKSKIEILPADM